jgi:transcriptional regulator with XRE-family HTH domain
MIDYEQIRRLRELKNLSQRQLGISSGVAGSLISRIESGQRIPSLRLLIRIAEALGVHPGQLILFNRDAGEN